MGKWLLKSEPEEWSWEHQRSNGGISEWDGVRNALAQKNLRAMLPGDLCFFYHSGKAKEIVGIARVCKPFYPDSSDESGKCCMVDIEAVSEFRHPVSLARLKQEVCLKDFVLFRQTRLSVVPVSEEFWARICEMGDEEPSPIRNEDTREEGETESRPDAEKVESKIKKKRRSVSKAGKNQPARDERDQDVLSSGNSLGKPSKNMNTITENGIAKSAIRRKRKSQSRTA